MSSSSPADLAIAFRSINRRLHEAQGDAPPEVTASATAELEAHLEDAGRMMGTSADPQSIADAIASTHPDRWESATLTRLQAIALEIGTLLRHVAELTGNG
jgi:hypothetical protein